MKSCCCKRNLFTDEDASFMREALLEAKKAFDLDEVPVGAVAVFKGNIISRAHNEVERLRDASAHAELLCMRRAAEILGAWRLLGVTLYTTLEPCSLCAGAAFSFRVQKIIYGAPDVRQGAAGSWVSLFSIPHPIHAVSVDSGLLAEESAGLLKTFFQKKREQKNAKNS